MIVLLQSEATAARRNLPIKMVSSVDGVTEVASLTLTVQIRKNGGTWTAAGGTVTEPGGTGNGQGSYTYQATQAELDTVGPLEYRVTGTGAKRFDGLAHVWAANVFDSVRLGLTSLPNAAAETLGGLYTRGTGAGQINQNAFGQIDARTVGLSSGASVAVFSALKANQVIDNTTFDSDGMLTQCRVRFFPDSATTNAATDGGIGQGELIALTLTAVGTDGQFDIQKVV